MYRGDMPKQLPETTDARIRELYLQRFTDREIAHVLGIHRVTVTRRRLAQGVTRRDRTTPAAA